MSFKRKSFLRNEFNFFFIEINYCSIFFAWYYKLIFENMAFQLLVEKVIGTTKTKKLRNQNPPKMVLKQSRKIKRIEKLSLKNDSKDLDTVEIIMALFLDEVIMILR